MDVPDTTRAGRRRWLWRQGGVCAVVLLCLAWQGGELHAQDEVSTDHSTVHSDGATGPSGLATDDPYTQPPARISFPIGDLFPALIADPKEPRFFMSMVALRTDEDKVTAGLVGLGTTFGIFRWPGQRPEDGWQVNWFGAVFSQFNLDAPSDDLINTDYLVGLPLAYRHGPFSMRWRLYHQSSHLGDEFILGGGAPERINLSIEVLDALFAYDFNSWRGYGGAAFIVNADPENFDRWAVQLGGEYRGRGDFLWGGRLVGGLDVKWLQESNWDDGVSVMAGLEFGRPDPVRRGTRLMMQGYSGFAPFGQFYGQDLSYVGVGLYFDI